MSWEVSWFLFLRGMEIPLQSIENIIFLCTGTYLTKRKLLKEPILLLLICYNFFFFMNKKLFFYPSKTEIQTAGKNSFNPHGIGIKRFNKSYYLRLYIYY